MDNIERVDEFKDELLKGHVSEVLVGIRGLASIHQFTNTLVSQNDRPLAECLLDKDAVRSYVLALFVELGEFIQELDWKPWRKKPREADKHRVLDEFADILAFTGVLITILQAHGFTTADIAEAYRRKEIVNMERFLAEERRKAAEAKT